MGSLRFRRTVRIAPGIRLNVNKRSVGVSAGVRGARVSINSDGRSTRSVGVPGTGLYYRDQTGPRSVKRTSADAPRLESPARLFRRLVGWSTGGLCVLLVVNGKAHAGGVVLAVGLIAWLVLRVASRGFDLLFFAWFSRRARNAATPTLGPSGGTATSPPSEEDELAEANVPSDWASSDAWLSWEAPQDLVAGESHYMDALRELTGEPRENGYLIPVDVRFVREPTNKYDANAWRAEVRGSLIGYARRHIAAQLSPALDGHGCTEFTVCGVLRGGSISAPNMGVHVWADRRPQPGPELHIVDTTLAVAWPPDAAEGVGPAAAESHLAAADLFDAYLRDAQKTMANRGPEDRALEFLKSAADIAIANDSTEQKEAAALAAEQLMKYAMGTQTLARAARLKKRLEPKIRATRATAETVEDRLTRLDELRERGTITQDEYATQRAAIIKRL